MRVKLLFGFTVLIFVSIVSIYILNIEIELSTPYSTFVKIHWLKSLSITNYNYTADKWRTNFANANTVRVHETARCQVPMTDTNTSTMYSTFAVPLLNGSGSFSFANTSIYTYFDNATMVDLHSDCNNTVRFPQFPTLQDTWMVVDEAESAFTFSAYFEEDYWNLTVIGAKTLNTTQYLCQLWYQLNGNHTVMLEVSATADLIAYNFDGQGRKYGTGRISCCNPNNIMIPDYVSIVTQSCSQPMNLLKVHTIKSSDEPQVNFTVCLSPLNSQYNHAYEIVQWIEFNRILGANKFVIYNFSSSQNLSRVFEFYSKQNLTNVIQWQLPIDKNNKVISIHYYAQVTALNDCLFRNKKKSKFIVNIDIDEFIIPRSQGVMNWTSMLHQLPNNSCAYRFRNTFFPRNWDNGNFTLAQNTEVRKYEIVSLEKTVREDKIYPTAARSKYFANTVFVKSVRIHNILEVDATAGNGIQYVGPNIGLLHHYRHWYSNNNQTRVTDDIVVTKYRDILVRNVKEIWSKL